MLELAETLQFYPAEFRPSQVESLGSAGGMSGAQFWRLTTPSGKLVLRRWPAGYPSPDRLRFIHSALAFAAQKGIHFVPVPVAIRSGETFVPQAGHLWELTPWMPGSADFELAPSGHKLRAALAALAQFHLATVDFPADRYFNSGSTANPSAVVRHFDRLHALTQGAAAELSRAAANPAWPELAPLAADFLQALPRAIPRAVAQLEPLQKHPFPRQPCIRDIWHDHVLFTASEVTGLIDFGALDIDTPATDIARLVSSLTDTPLAISLSDTPLPFRHSDSPLPFREGQGEGSESSSQTVWQTALAAYSSIRPLSDPEVRAARALASSGAILAGCNWLRWINLEGRTFESRDQVLTRFRHILARVQSPT